MKKLKVDLVLLYYDYPQVFIGKDEVDSRYVCMITDDGAAGPNFACIPASSQRIQDLIAGKIDLRDAFLAPEVPDIFIANFSRSQDVRLSMRTATYDRLPLEFLPDAGLAFEGYDEVSLAAAEMNTTVSFVSLEVPESAESARIKATTLAQFLNIFQSMVRNFGRVAARAAKKPLKRGDDSSSADVFGFAMGSFTVKFRSSYPNDILGENPAFSVAMDQLNKFLSVANDPTEGLAFLQSVRGHTASSLIKMLNFLLENSAPIRMDWATPSMKASAHARVRLDAIKVLVDLCRERSDLTFEEVVIRGRVSKADVTAGTWKIESEDSREVSSGAIAPGKNITLKGVIIATTLYEFKCQEVVEIIPATGQEIRQLLLQSFKEV